ncbi:anthrone oxygenase family protein [Embleya sp. NPDC055664]|uniref:anthrone oxygenase family protein n=1 Tax=Embleya sp. NPDC059237 TaxID=3346784 RepID=UPI00368A593D
MSGPLFVLTLVTAIGCATMGGVFYGFSSFVMAGLGRLPANQGAAAMRALNVEAPKPPLMIGLLGTSVLCAGLGVTALVSWDGAYSGYLIAGALSYLIGPLGLTAGYHVPRNNALDRVEPNSQAEERLWATFPTEWTRANHLRALGGVAAAVCLTLALTR